jgi:hypothetical protein
MNEEKGCGSFKPAISQGKATNCSLLYFSRLPFIAF